MEQGGGGAVVPVLCDTVVAVAVVVEIDLEVKESVVHYCSVVVIKSFGAIINVLVTFPIFIICSPEKTFHFHEGPFPTYRYALNIGEIP